ncbi:Vac17p NDAI_0A00130 [Naumovozyma dairenensis CBS 421]|uniref:Uncharacterized protein n=1 Tax=Naumovozyma dairenensis (strain ATCC 10597 / BCRC 20456 / CBS 421 / NBRC 0211 / NRRL Y-12639) TaxID=1071378 RepID=G0W5F9_NAUDC|nr:hypothetical protein NDAI_0A00130 [Naumovozyma dairenensis CBS 421]CCD22173.1 hypothetical protein NDAI_0A00130 [Naumovozyma dairenensis CBS 421]
MSTTLQDITERLLIRSQEAILQLDLWIQREKKQQELSTLNNSNNITYDHVDNQQYNVYLAQLNSLIVRVQYIRDKFLHNINQLDSTQDEQKYIENLVYEFKQITLKLNDLSKKNKTTSSSENSSKTASSKSSMESFEPKPLKIIKRTKNDQKVSNTINNDHDLIMQDENLQRPNSLPSSPIEKSSYVTISQNEQNLRLMKSQDFSTKKNTSRNTNYNTIRKFENDTINQFFKSQQRLSIGIFDNDDDNIYSTNMGTATRITGEYLTDNNSDQATVISQGTIKRNDDDFTPLRRYNSHESILSQKISSTPLIDNNNNLTFNSKLPLYSSIRRPSMQSIHVTSNPIFARSSQGKTSKDLLSSFVTSSIPRNNNRNIQTRTKTRTQSRRNNQLRDHTINQTSTSSFFGNWNFLNRFNMITSETNTTTNRKRNYNIPLVNQSRAHNIDVNDTMDSISIKEPVYDNTISLDDLEDALNTELLL